MWSWNINGHAIPQPVKCLENALHSKLVNDIEISDRNNIDVCLYSATDIEYIIKFVWSCSYKLAINSPTCQHKRQAWGIYAYIYSY